MPKRSIRVIILSVCALLTVVLAYIGYQNYRAPDSGGPQGDGYFSTLRKKQIYASFTPEQERGFTRLTPENANGWYSNFVEPVQSFELYQSQDPTRPTETRKIIVLQPLGNFNEAQKAMLKDLETYCGIFFQLPTRIAEPMSLKKVEQFSRPSGYSQGQKQFDAGKIMSEILIPTLPNDAALVLGITMQDLYGGNLSFVFGQGTWHERVGVYSLLRYFPKDATKISATDRTKAFRRGCQVLNHEAGHMFGLSHCTIYKCSMNGANSLADSDQTPIEFCPVCRQKIAWNLGLDMKKRDSELARFYEKHDLDGYLIQITH